MTPARAEETTGRGKNLSERRKFLPVLVEGAREAERGKEQGQSPRSNPITSLTMVREVSGDSVKVTYTGVREDGTAANFGFTAKL